MSDWTVSFRPCYCPASFRAPILAEMTDADLTSRLQRALGDRYTIERELGGGGMSRLFLAREPSLGREVVVKLLPPELSSDMSAARFQREIELAARFQHPNIVPVLAGGASEGLLFYVMPFVRGESLRRLLSSRQQIPLERALAIVDEVADALAYAHSEGVVHRDIKPENILLSAGHAEVTDFGVARAVEAARSGEHLTGTGIAVGSPGYMSPEQLAGEKSIDARSDQYALGTVAYELLAGAPPFEAPTLQGLLTAQLTQLPRPLSERRSDVPAHVSAAISRALAKDPNERFSDIAGFRAALKGAAPVGVQSGRRLPSRVVAAVVVLALVVAALVSLTRRSGSDELDPNLIAVAPFTVLDPSLALWREGMVDVLARKLDGAGPLRAVPPSVSVRRFDGRGDEASAAALARATGAGLALFGTLFAQGHDSARLEATLYDVKDQRRVSEVVFVDATSQLARLTDSATVLLLKDLGRGVPRLSSLVTSSLSALKEYLQGEQFFRRSAWDSAEAHYDRAVSIDSSFVLALHRLTLVYGWRGSLNDPQVLEHAERASRRAHGLSLHDSLIIRASALRSETVGAAPTSLSVGNSREIRRLLEEAVRMYPESQDAAMAFADDVFHFGALSHRRASDMLTLFDRVIALDSNFTPAYLHPITLSLAMGDTAAGHRYASAYQSRNPSDDDADAVRALLHVLSSDNPSRAFATLVDTASNTLLRDFHPFIVRWFDADEWDIRVSTRMHAQAHATLRGVVPPNVTRIFAHALALRGHLRQAAALIPEALRETGALANMGGRPLALELALLGGLSSAEADPLFYRIADEPIGFYTGHLGIPYFALRRDTLVLRRLVMRIDSLRRAAPALTSVLGPGARAYLALARGDSTGALREFDAMPDSVVAENGVHIWHLTHAQLLARAGRWRDAQALLQSEPSYWATPVGVLWKLERARVAEQQGNPAAAREEYALVVAAWRNPDEQLRVYVDEARRALARLSPDAPKSGARP
jgi:eukaryotic-like serine/threonine-protein kinase